MTYHERSENDFPVSSMTRNDSFDANSTISVNINIPVDGKEDIIISETIREAILLESMWVPSMQ